MPSTFFPSSLFHLFYRASPSCCSPFSFIVKLCVPAVMSSGPFDGGKRAATAAWAQSSLTAPRRWGEEKCARRSARGRAGRQTALARPRRAEPPVVPRPPTSRLRRRTASFQPFSVVFASFASVAGARRRVDPRGIAVLGFSTPRAESPAVRAKRRTPTVAARFPPISIGTSSRISRAFCLGARCRSRPDRSPRLAPPGPAGTPARLGSTRLCSIRVAAAASWKRLAQSRKTLRPPHLLFALGIAFGDSLFRRDARELSSKTQLESPPLQGHAREAAMFT